MFGHQCISENTREAQPVSHRRAQNRANCPESLARMADLPVPSSTPRTRMTKNIAALVPAERIAHRIVLVRGEKVLLDADLAGLYGVSTGRLNEQVRRNLA